MTTIEETNLLNDTLDLLQDLGACDDVNCERPSCKHVMPRLLAWVRQRSDDAETPHKTKEAQ